MYIYLYLFAFITQQSLILCWYVSSRLPYSFHVIWFFFVEGCPLQLRVLSVADFLQHGLWSLLSPPCL